MTSGLNTFLLIDATLIYIALLGTLVGLVLQLASELHRPELRHGSHDFGIQVAGLMTQVATESHFDLNKSSANNTQRDAA